MEIYHGSTVIVEKPEIRIERFNKDFYFGFYCTVMEQQAIRWATRFGEGIVNVYEYYPNDSLKTLKFEKMTEEWLDFIIACRSGIPHDWDIVEGPMADDTIYNYIQEQRQLYIIASRGYYNTQGLDFIYCADQCMNPSCSRDGYKSDRREKPV